MCFSNGSVAKSQVTSFSRYCLSLWTHKYLLCPQKFLGVFYKHWDHTQTMHYYSGKSLKFTSNICEWNLIPPKWVPWVMILKKTFKSQNSSGFFPTFKKTPCGEKKNEKKNSLDESKFGIFRIQRFFWHLFVGMFHGQKFEWKHGWCDVDCGLLSEWHHFDAPCVSRHWTACKNQKITEFLCFSDVWVVISKTRGEQPQKWQNGKVWVFLNSNSIQYINTKAFWILDWMQKSIELNLWNLKRWVGMIKNLKDVIILTMKFKKSPRFDF